MGGWNRGLTKEINPILARGENTRHKISETKRAKNSIIGYTIKYGEEIGKKDKTHRFIELQCPVCGNKRWVELYKFIKGKTPLCRRCFMISIRKTGPGPKASRWKGGRRLRQGYIQVWLSSDDPYYSMADKHGYVLEHRLVMAQHLGRPLTRDENVHHLNGIRTDNRFCNLALVSPNTHPKITRLKLAQKRIRDLEAQLAQQKFDLRIMNEREAQRLKDDITGVTALRKKYRLSKD